MSEGVVLAVAAVVSAVASIAGTGLQQQAQQRQRQLQMDALQRNALEAQQQAELAASQQERLAEIAVQDVKIQEDARAFDRRREERQLARVVGISENLVGSAGVLLEGSPAEVIDDLILESERDILARDFQSSLAQRQLLNQTNVLEFGAGLSRRQGREAQRAADVSVGLLRLEGAEARTSAAFSQVSSLLTGASGVARSGVLRRPPGSGATEILLR